MIDLDNPYAPPDILIELDQDGEWARLRRAYWRWKFGMVILIVVFGILAGQELAGVIIASIAAILIDEWPCFRFRQFANSAIRERLPEATLSGHFVGVAALPSHRRLGRGSDYVDFLEIGEDITLHLHDRDLVIANSAIRAVRQVKFWMGIKAVQLTFVEQGGVRQIVLIGKAASITGMRRASQAIFDQLKHLEPKQLFTLK